MIYINDLPRLQKSNLFLLAYDTCPYHQSSDIFLLSEAMNKVMQLKGNQAQAGKISDVTNINGGYHILKEYLMQHYYEL